MESRHEKPDELDSGSEFENENEDEEGNQKNKDKKAKEEESKGHQPIKKSDEEIRKAQFLGQETGYF